MKLTIILVALVATLTNSAVVSQVPMEETLMPSGTPVLIRGATLSAVTPTPNTHRASQTVTVGEPISVPREYRNAGDTASKETLPRPGAPGRQYHQYHQNPNLHSRRDQEAPNTYPYTPIEDYNTEEFDDEIIFILGSFVIVAVCMASLIIACRKINGQRRDRNMKRVQQAHPMGRNPLQNVNSQIRFHQEEAARLRALLHQQTQVNQQPRHQFNAPSPMLYEMSVAHNPLLRKDNYNESYAPQNVYPGQYAPFRNENEISEIRVQNPSSEAYSDYPRL